MPDDAVFISLLTRIISLPTFVHSFLVGSNPPFANAEEENTMADSAISVCCFIRVPDYSYNFLIVVYQLNWI